MDFGTYQEVAGQTAFYPGRGGQTGLTGLMYAGLGLNGEAGEVAENIKKLARGEWKPGATPDDRIKAIYEELGDVMWYVAAVADELQFDLNAVAQFNLDKLATRAAEREREEEEALRDG